MLEWLLHTDFDAPVIAALWSAVTAGLATVVLFVYTLGLRTATVVAVRRRDRLVRKWRETFALAIASAEAAATMPLPTLGRGQWTDVLEELNGMWETVDGDSTDNLIVVAQRLDLAKIARKLLGRRRLKSKLLGAQTLGHLRDKESWDAIEACLTSTNTALSITAAAALTAIDPSRALEVVVPLIAERTDWPSTRLFGILRSAGSALVNGPLARAIRQASSDDQVYLLQFTPLGEFGIMDELLEELLRESDDPHVLSAALKHVSGHGGVPRIAWLTRHSAWFVRMRAATLLGSVGQREHLPLLTTLLEDSEWWVRYRAAQAIVKLPFLGPNALRQLHDHTTDRYGRDILEHAMAEVGLA